MSNVKLIVEIPVKPDKNKGCSSNPPELVEIILDKDFAELRYCGKFENFSVSLDFNQLKEAIADLDRFAQNSHS